MTGVRLPDKAFTPHPAVVRQCLMRRFARLIMPTNFVSHPAKLSRNERPGSVFYHTFISGLETILSLSCEYKKGD